MSKLTQFFHKYDNTSLVRNTVEYLETVNISGEAKKKVAITVVKLLHVAGGNQWDKALETAVGGAIEFVLGEIRDAANKYGKTSIWGDPLPTPAPPPTGASIYDTPHDGALPDEPTLLDMGYKSGDLKWVNGNLDKWVVGHPGGIVGGYDLVGPIGG